MREPSAEFDCLKHIPDTDFDSMESGTCNRPGKENGFLIYISIRLFFFVCLFVVTFIADISFTYMYVQ